MFEISHPETNRIDISISVGRSMTTTMRDALTQLIDLSSSIQEGKMLYRITNFELPTLSALVVELTAYTGFVPANTSI